MLGVDVGTDAAVALGLGDHVHGEGGLARGLGAVHLDDAAAGQAADAEGQVEGERPRGDRLDPHRGLLAHLHDRALAELLLDLAEGHVECLVSLHRCLLVVSYVVSFSHVPISFLRDLRRPGGRLRWRTAGPGRGCSGDVDHPTKGV